MGSPVIRTPTASSMAFATAAIGGTDVDFPDPLHAVGVAGVRDFHQHRFDHRQIRGDRHPVVEESRILEAALVVVDVLLVQGPSDALGRPSLDLPLDIARVDRPVRRPARRST